MDCHVPEYCPFLRHLLNVVFLCMYTYMHNCSTYMYVPVSVAHFVHVAQLLLMILASIAAQVCVCLD